MIAFLRDVFLKDFGLKTFSLVLAALLYLVVYYAKTDRGVPLRLSPGKERVFSGLEIIIMSSAGVLRDIKIQPTAAEVTVKGDAAIIEDLKPKDIHVLVNLTDITGASALRKRIEVSTPPGVTYLKVNPEDVQVVFPPDGAPSGGR